MLETVVSQGHAHLKGNQLLVQELGLMLLQLQLFSREAGKPYFKGIFKRSHDKCILGKNCMIFQILHVKIHLSLNSTFHELSVDPCRLCSSNRTHLLAGFDTRTSGP